MAHSMDQKPPKMAKIETKKEVKVSFKVTLLQNDSRFTKMCLFNEIEVQRFVIPKDRRKSLVYLKEIIGSLFEEHIKNGMKVYWRDSDRDYVRIKSDDGLIIALSEMKNEIYHLYVIAER